MFWCRKQVMCSTLEFRRFVARLALQFLIFMVKLLHKLVQMLLWSNIWLHFCCLFTPPSFGSEQREKEGDIYTVSNLGIDRNKINIS